MTLLDPKKDSKKILVYTDSRKTYHAKNCRFVHKGLRQLTLIEAGKMNLVACKLCKPPTIPQSP